MEVWVLNRRIFEASFPDAIRKSEFDLEKASVPVRVLPTKNPITLVLCSYESVRWVIQADKEAKIEKIVVGGYHIQDVVGTTAPVAFHDLERPRAEKVQVAFFYAYHSDDENYSKLVQTLRKLTDKEVSTFQGRYSYDKGPRFVVGGN